MNFALQTMNSVLKMMNFVAEYLGIQPSGYVSPYFNPHLFAQLWSDLGQISPVVWGRFPPLCGADLGRPSAGDIKGAQLLMDCGGIFTCKTMILY